MLCLPGELLQSLQYKTVVMTSMVVEQHCVAYKISIHKSLYFTTYFNRRPGTWLAVYHLEETDFRWNCAVCLLAVLAI